MNRDEVAERAFFDELEKIAAARGRMHFPKSRIGRRSISVDNLLKKEKQGLLYKEAVSDSSPKESK